MRHKSHFYAQMKSVGDANGTSEVLKELIYPTIARHEYLSNIAVSAKKGMPSNKFSGKNNLNLMNRLLTAVSTSKHNYLRGEVRVAFWNVMHGLAAAKQHLYCSFNHTTIGISALAVSQKQVLREGLNSLARAARLRCCRTGQDQDPLSVKDVALMYDVRTNCGHAPQGEGLQVFGNPPRSLRELKDDIILDCENEYTEHILRELNIAEKEAFTAADEAEAEAEAESLRERQELGLFTYDMYLELSADDQQLANEARWTDFLENVAADERDVGRKRRCVSVIASSPSKHICTQPLTCVKL